MNWSLRGVLHAPVVLACIFLEATIVTREASTLLGSFYNHVPFKFCKCKENTANQLVGWSVIHKPHVTSWNTVIAKHQIAAVQYLC